MTFSDKTKAIVAAVIPALTTLVAYFAADRQDVVVIFGAIVTALTTVGVYASPANKPAE